MHTACTEPARTMEGTGAPGVLEELIRVRDALRSEDRARTVCTDAVLEEMASRLPSRTEDLEAIPGVGQRFTELYGEAFLSVTREASARMAGGTGMRCCTAEALSRLEKELTDLGKGNRMLFLPRLYRAGALDAAALPRADVMGALFGGGELSTEDADQDVRRSAVEIVRGSNRELRDRGVWDLYIAYPFAEGRLEDGFEIRAPLALFPAAVRREKGTVLASVDASRDPILNGALVLAGMRASGEDGPMPDLAVEDASEEGFVDRVLEFYRSAGIGIDDGDRSPTRFEGGESVRGPSGTGLRLVPYAVLGRFPLYSSHVQKDLESIIRGSTVSAVLDRMTGPPPDGMKEPEIVHASERDLLCSSPLDPAQERVLASVASTDGMVVHGPPGTGKSQVITQIAVSAAARGMSVLVVSEKKTALDVVRSRLGSLSAYCMAMDDAGDKDAFYSQFERAVSMDEPPEPPSLDDASEEAEEALRRLDEARLAAYADNGTGAVPARLYSDDLARRASGSPPGILEECVPGRARSQEYARAAEMHAMFSDPETARLYRDYREAVRKHPVLLAMRDDLTPKDLASFEKDAMVIAERWKEWMRAGPSERRMDRIAMEKESSAVMGRYFSGMGREALGAVLKDPEAAVAALESYAAYSRGSRTFGDADPCWKSYGNGMLELSEATGDSLARSESRMFGLVEAEQTRIVDGRTDLSALEEFDDRLGEAGSAMDRKREAVRAFAAKELHGRLDSIKESRRFPDMVRIARSRRRWSPGRFMSRFGYEMLSGIRVWLMTPEAASELLPLETGLFDLLVIDEASQMFMERGVPAMQRARRMVVAGDPKQLRPSSVGSGRYGGEDCGSLLDAACERLPSFLLDHHYRSRRSALIAFSNRAFYGGRLKVAPDASPDTRAPIEVRAVDGVWEDRRNVREAEEAVKVLRETLETGETVGIITFNALQRDLVLDVLEDECASDPAFGRRVAEEMRRTENGEDAGLFVKNVESVQGDERDVIIFSVGYARDRGGRMSQRFGWLNARGGENRLNVAVTRARSRMVVIRSLDPEDIRSDSGTDGPGLFRSFLRYADAVSSGDGRRAEEVLDGLGPKHCEASDPGSTAAEDAVERALRRAGFGVERNAGSDGYAVDLAVTLDGKPVLGVESDTRLYASDPDPRTRDCLRRRYLESMGWRIERMWTPMLWRDQEAETARIVAAAREAASSNLRRQR